MHSQLKAPSQQAPPFRVTDAGGTQGGPAPPTSKRITPNNNDFVIGAVGLNYGTGADVSLTPGQTSIGSVTSSRPEVAAEYTIASGTTTTMSYTLGSNQGWFLILDAIKAP